MTIRRYVIVNADDQEEDWEYDRFDEAKREALKRSSREPLAIIAREYVFDDSDLVWTSTGEEGWPPETSEDEEGAE